MEQENIMQSFMTMWNTNEDAVAADTTKLALDFKAKVGQELSKKIGATPNATPNAPKVINQAVVKAATDDPVTASKALNPDQKAMKKKMKKENVFPTLQQWREAGCGCGVGTAGSPGTGGKNPDWKGSAGGIVGAPSGGKLDSVGDVNMKKKSSKK